jgi:microcystin-dependent protein
MASPYVGEIRLFAGNFAPVGWALAQGQLLPIAQNSALFALLGTVYGGDGSSTFGLPDLRGRVPVGFGTGPNLSNYNLGQKGGTETQTITVNQIPSHTHPLNITAAAGTTDNPKGALLATGSGATLYSTTGAAAGTLATSAVGPAAGGGQPLTNVQPYIALNYIIATQGLFPAKA